MTVKFEWGWLTVVGVVGVAGVTGVFVLCAFQYSKSTRAQASGATTIRESAPAAGV